MLLSLCCVLLYCDVDWCVKDSAVHYSHQHQQWFVAKWLGVGVTVRMRIMARAREWNYFFFFLSVLKCDNTFVLHSWYVHSMMVTM